MKFIQNLLNSILYIAVFNFQACDASKTLHQLAQQTTNNQASTDMQSPLNIMFDHSADIYPEDDPTIRFVQSARRRYFQPADGSMKNGVYHKNNHQAETTFHTYDNVIQIDGTKQQPKMDENNQYIDNKGKKLELIGIFDEYSENDGEKKMYYLFGTIKKTKNSENINNAPLTGYATFPQQ